MTISPITKQIKLDIKDISEYEITLKDFWNYYFTILININNQSLTPRSIELLSYVCSKDSNISQFKGEERKDMIAELSITNPILSQSLTELIKFGLLERPEGSKRGEVYLSSRLKALQTHIYNRVQDNKNLLNLLFKFKIEKL